jgi:hypothetical protein
MNARRVVPGAVLLLATFIGSGATASAQPSAPAGIPDLSGGWVRVGRADTGRPGAESTR